MPVEDVPYINIKLRNPDRVDPDLKNTESQLASEAAEELERGLSELMIFADRVSSAVQNREMARGLLADHDPYGYAQNSRALALAERTEGVLETARNLSRELSRELSVPDKGDN